MSPTPDERGAPPTEQELAAAVEAPGPTGAELKDTLERFANDPLTEGERLYRAYGDVVALKRGPFVSVLLFHPDHARHVLVTRAKAYSRRTATAERTRLAIGDGLVTADGSAWEEQRARLVPAFTGRSIEAWLPIIERAAVDLTHRLRELAPGPVNLHAEFGRTILALVGELLLGDALSASEARVVRRALEAAANLDRSLPQANAFELAESEWRARSGGEPVGKFDDFFAAREAYGALLDRRIALRRAGAPAPDVLGSLIGATSDGAPLPAPRIREELQALVSAAHDTTMTLLAALFFELGHSRAEATELRHEADRVLGRFDGFQHPARPVSNDVLAALTHCEAAVAEALRLYPPVAYIDRRAETDDVIDGMRIRKGTVVSLSPWVVQRREDLWEEPTVFRPSRFLGRARGAYFPFGMGSRTCLGRTLALTEAKILTSYVVRAFDIAPAPGFTLAWRSTMTLLPVDSAVWVQLTERRLDG